MPRRELAPRLEQKKMRDMFMSRILPSRFRLEPPDHRPLITEYWQQQLYL